jgi:pimeloyl-ACP methyl ester carboxylesterase
VTTSAPDEEVTMSDNAWPEFRWLERGEGEPVLFLHGLMGQMDHWELTLEALADICRPMALALPILDPGLRETSIEALGRHVGRFLAAIDMPRVVIGGNSLGGHVALELALSYPERVSGLILTGSSGLFERSFTRGVPHRPTAEYVRAKMEEVFYRPDLVTPEWVESVRRTVTAPASALRVLRFARAAKRHSVEGRLEAIRVPTLLVWGRNDRITPPPVAERFRSLIADSELALLSACGHAPMLERPEVFAAVVAEWLSATRPRREARPALAGGLR